MSTDHWVLAHRFNSNARKGGVGQPIYVFGPSGVCRHHQFSSAGNGRASADASVPEGQSNTADVNLTGTKDR
jgi:hypothetical protein